MKALFLLTRAVQISGYGLLMHQEKLSLDSGLNYGYQYVVALLYIFPVVLLLGIGEYAILRFSFGQYRIHSTWISAVPLMAVFLIASCMFGVWGTYSNATHSKLVLTALVISIFVSLLSMIAFWKRVSRVHESGDSSGDQAQKLEDIPEITSDFQKIDLFGRTCFYHELESGRVVFIKPAGEFVRIGLLNGWYSSKRKYENLTVNLSPIAGSEEPYEAIGQETGFMYREIRMEELKDWREAYRRLEELVCTEKLYVWQPCTIHEYSALVHGCSEKSLRRY